MDTIADGHKACKVGFTKRLPLILGFEKTNVYLGKGLEICVITRFIGSSITLATLSPETKFENLEPSSDQMKYRDGLWIRLRSRFGKNGGNFS